MELYNKFRAVPEEAKKPIKGGRLSGFTDINPMWRIKMLTEQYGPSGIGWYTEILEKKLEKGANGEIAAFMDINLFVRNGEEWSKGIFGTGGSTFVANEKAGLYTSDECFKMAYTDALSVACKSLGMGADVYFEKDRTKYDQQADRTTAKTQPEEPKPEPLTDMETVQIALSEMTTAKEVADYWRANKEMQGNQAFVKLVTEKGKKLKANENK